MISIAFIILALAEANLPNELAQSAHRDDGGSVAAPEKVPYFVSEELVKLCEPGQFTVHQNGQPSRTLDYRLFQPARNDRREEFPLFVWMHGHGEHELLYRNVGQLKHIKDLMFPDLTDPSKFRFYLLAVQCPKDELWISEYTSCDECTTACDPAEVTILIVEHLIQMLPIDKDRIYLVGISSGGTASWKMARRHPDLFAAVAPLASAGGDNEGLERITGVPIWAFHVTDDPDASVELVRATINQLLRLGANCALTETQGEPHDCWGTAFRDFGLSQWLMAQRRGNSNSPPPGTFISAVARWGPLGRSLIAASRYWPQLSVVAILVSIYWLVRRERKTLRPTYQAKTAADTVAGGHAQELRNA